MERPQSKHNIRNVRKVEFPDLYEPTGLLVRGLQRDMDRSKGIGAGSNTGHYSSKEKLPAVENLDNPEHAALIDMFAFNANAPRRFHRQSPVSSGAAFQVARGAKSSNHVSHVDAVDDDGDAAFKLG